MSVPSEMQQATANFVADQELLVSLWWILLMFGTSEPTKEQLSTLEIRAQANIEGDLAVVDVEVKLAVLVEGVFYCESMVFIQLVVNMWKFECRHLADDSSHEAVQDGLLQDRGEDSFRKTRSLVLYENKLNEPPFRSRLESRRSCSCCLVG
jgi:hypothetical protein